MQIDQTCTKRQNNYHNLRLSFTCSLFQEYEVRFPQTEVTKIFVANISGWMHERIQSQWQSLERRVAVERVYDLKKWINGLAISKKMSELEHNNVKQSSILSPFDALIWNQDNQLYGAYPTQIQKIAKIDILKRQMSHYLIRKFYFSQLADYHTFNIAFQTIEEDSLCWNINLARPFLRLSRNWKIVEYEGTCYSRSQDYNDPYTQDLSKLQYAIYKMNKPQLEPIRQQQQQKFDQSKLLQLKQLFNTIYHKSYDQFIKKFTQIFQTPFILKDNQQFSIHLKQFYNLKNDNNNLKLVLQQQRGQYLSGTMNAASIQKLHSTCLEEKVINSQYPCFVERIIYQIGMRQSQMIILQSMPKYTKQERVRWHFLKSKIESQAGNYYRALAHLRQARRQTEDQKMLYVIKFSEARNWQHLGQVDKAEANYNQSISSCQSTCPASLPLLLGHLKNLYWKQGKIEQGLIVEQKIKGLKKVNNIYKIAKISQFGSVKLTASISQRISSFQRPKKSWQTLFGSMQTQLMEMEKSQKVQLLGQYKLGVFLLTLMRYAQYKNPAEQIRRMKEDIVEQVIQNLELIKRSNLRNYHRFLFMLSFEVNLETAVGFIKQMLAAKNVVYSQVVRWSLVKRLAQLYKRYYRDNQLFQKLVRLYRSQNVIQSGDMQCLFDFIDVLAKSQHFSAVITSGTVYLNSIKNYHNLSSPRRSQPTCRVLDHSYQVKLLMLRSYGRLRCYDELIRIVKEIQTESEIHERTKNIRLFIGELCQLICYVYDSSQLSYQAGQFELYYTLIQKIIHYDCIIQLQSKTKVSTDLQLSGVKQKHSSDIERIYRAYTKILARLNIKPNDTDLKWFKATCREYSQITLNVGVQRDGVNTMTQKISIGDIVRLLNQELKQRQPSLKPIFHMFHILSSQSDGQKLFEQLVGIQINEIQKIQGVKSLTANILHILLLTISLKQEKKVAEMYLLYWLSSFKMSFDLPEDLRDYWASKQGRDLRLDELLFHYFEDHIQQNECQTLQKLSWFKTIEQELIQLKNQYKEIVCFELERQDQKLQLKIINFSIKYRTHFDTALQESDTLIKMNQILAQLDCPDDQL